MNDPVGLPGLLDAVIVLTVFEVTALWTWNAWTGRGVAPRDFVLNALAGLCLMLALRGYARELGASWIVLCLCAAGAAHAADLWSRWRRARAATHANRSVAA